MAQLLKKSAKKVVAAKVSSIKVFAVSKSASSSAIKTNPHVSNPSRMMNNPASTATSRFKKPTNVHHVVKPRPIARSPLPSFNDQNSLLVSHRTNNTNNNVNARKDSFYRYRQKQPVSKSPIH